MQNEDQTNLRRLGRRKIALILAALIIFASIEVYVHTYVQIHGLPVVSEEQIRDFSISHWQDYTGTYTFSSSGCRWLVGWIVRRPAPQNGYVEIFKTEQNGSNFVLGTDLLILDLEATSNHTGGFSAHIDEIDYESNHTAIRIDYELGEIGTYEIEFQLQVRVYERMLLWLIPKADVAIPINATLYYGP